MALPIPRVDLPDGFEATLTGGGADAAPAEALFRALRAFAPFFGAIAAILTGLAAAGFVAWVFAIFAVAATALAFVAPGAPTESEVTRVRVTREGIRADDGQPIPWERVGHCSARRTEAGPMLNLHLVEPEEYFLVPASEHSYDDVHAIAVEIGRRMVV